MSALPSMPSMISRSLDILVCSRPRACADWAALIVLEKNGSESSSARVPGPPFFRVRSQNFRNGGYAVRLQHVQGVVYANRREERNGGTAETFHDLRADLQQCREGLGSQAREAVATEYVVSVRECPLQVPLHAYHLRRQVYHYPLYIGILYVRGNVGTRFGALGDSGRHTCWSALRWP